MTVTDGTGSSVATPGGVRQRLAAARSDNLIVYVGFLAILVFFAVTLSDRGFLTADNFANIARQTAMVSIMAFGMTFVLASGEIDLSIGSVVGLTSLTVAVLLREDLPIPLAVAGALARRAARGPHQRPAHDQGAHPVVPRDAGHDEHHHGRGARDHGPRGRARHRRHVRVPVRLRQHRARSRC